LMLEALVNGLEGTQQPSAPDIAQLARGNARKKVVELTAALEGRQMRTSHRILIRHAMRHLAFLAAEVEELDEDIATMIRDSGLTPAHELLQTVPGIRTQAAAAILAESGPDMKQFPAVTNFSSWTGLAPGNNESAGKKKRAPALKGNPHIKTALVEAAWSASRTRESEFEDRHQRLKTRIGPKRAIVATAHTLAIRVYEVLDSVNLTRHAAPAFPPAPSAG
jgi:transposase